ncbi:MAG: metal ABC transporter substrate-binding protein [Pseudomonadota bacterium]
MPRISLAACVMLVAAPALADAPSVATTTYPLAYFAERLTGGEATIVFPVPEGEDPAFWRPSIPDIAAYQAADLILLNGAGFASWTEKTTLPRGRLIDTSRDLADGFIATETVTHTHGDGGEHSHTGTANFLWLDPARAAVQAAAAADGLVRRAGLAEADVAPRLSDLSNDLAELEAAADALSAYAAIPVIATHPRYQYFAEATGLSIDALDWDAGAAPSADQLETLAERIAETGAKVLIWEAEPPAAARDAVRGLGLADAVVPSLANRPDNGDFLGVYATGLADLTAAFESLTDG